MNSWEQTSQEKACSRYEEEDCYLIGARRPDLQRQFEHFGAVELASV